jgi:crossover junction endodeoxyribonuclease RuvC
MDYLAVDPGLHGGAAVLDSTGALVALTVLPLDHDRLDPVRLSAWVRDYAGGPGRSLAAVEMVGAMRGQGVTSTFSFGEVVGSIVTVVRLAGHQVVRLRPQSWQKAVGVALPAVKRPKGVKATKAEKAERRKAVKAAALAKVLALWPDAPIIPKGCRVPHDGLVDALLIAEALRLGHRPMAESDWLA